MCLLTQLACCLVLLALVALAQGAPLQYTCIDSTGRVEQCPQNARPQFTEHLVAFAKYANRINQTGWDELELVTNGQLEDKLQAYYAGYLEGFITARLIRSLRVSMLQEDKKQWCDKLSTFVKQNLAHTISEVNRNEQDPYWHEVGLSLYQVTGMDDGYTQAQTGSGKKKPHLEVEPCGMMLMNLYTEFSDILSIMKASKVQRETRCSAIVKVLPESGDVLVAHDTWSNYYTMLRIMKKLTLNFRTSNAKSVVMSSYPGNIFSTDDFYITSTQLVVLETSIENHNSSLWNGLNATNFVFEFIRNTVANRMATSGQEWANLFSRFNGGTYNNQFMIVDYKRLQGNKIESGLLTVLEQLPQFIMYRDMSDHLREHTYWPSYNVPYFHEVYHLSGNDQMYREHGDFYSYNKTARALIFGRDHHSVSNLTTLYHLMRSNNFKHDPLSRCNCTPAFTAEFAISARCDLNDPNGKYPIRDFTFRPHGAIDAKLTSSSLAAKLQMVAVSGPTDQDVPAFSWAQTKLHDVPHNDQPIEWNFKPVHTTWDKTDQVFPDFQFDL